ncbi:MAG: HAMP domain-containing sensor histidine kinase, partial [Chitinivibrionales bacterium]|nr:HAMP domain-containing sensor histidine kinase [Chitinivibrionales bacterium]
ALVLSLLRIGKKMEEALARSQRQERLAVLGTIAAELAHELKNPLAIIKSSVDVLQKTLDPGRAQRAFGFISDEIMRLSRLIGDILTLSRDHRVEQRWFAPAPVINAAATAVKGLWPLFAIVNQVPAACEIKGDPDAFVRIADNLMRNAAQAQGGAGDVTIRADFAAAEMQLHFLDNGPGVPPEIVGKLFDPFVSGAKTGTGLGLAIVNKLCRRCGYGVALRPQAQAKTCFTITIGEGLWRMS